MKRELKGWVRARPVFAEYGFTHHPDEEGTESVHPCHEPLDTVTSFTHHPDEEGTERIAVLGQSVSVKMLHTPSR